MKPITCPTNPIPSERSIARERAFNQLIAAYRMSAPGRDHFEQAALALALDNDDNEEVAA